MELADIVRAHGAAFRAAHGLCSVQHRALRAIEHCRTAALGGELRACDACGTQRYVYHSCRNRHCPKCQTRAKERWLAARRTELLPVPYYHLVFTLPHELNALGQGNPRTLYAMLGDWPAYLALLGLGWLIVDLVRRRRRSAGETRSAQIDAGRISRNDP